MVPTRGRGGGHDWIGVDALLWVDHVEIRLLLSRIKAVWGAMRHVRGVVAIVMVHEVEREELDGLVRRIYTRKKKDSRAEKRKKEGEEEREERRGNGHWLESKGRGDEVRFDFSNNVYVLSKIRFYIYFYFSQSLFRGTIHPSGIWSMNDDRMTADTPLPSISNIERCDRRTGTVHLR